MRRAWKTAMLLMAAMLMVAMVQAQPAPPPATEPAPIMGTSNTGTNAQPATQSPGSAITNGNSVTTPAAAVPGAGWIVPSTKNGARSLTVNVPGNEIWTNTGITVHRGDKIAIQGEGQLSFGEQNQSGPEGLPRSWRDLLRALPVNGAGDGALIGRVGEGEAAIPFLIGAKKELVANQDGPLFVGVNEAADNVADGNYRVVVEVTPAAKASAPAAKVDLPQSELDKVPRRVADAAGNPGDMVNFLLIGPQASLEKVFADAGWVQTDKTKAEATVHAIFATLSRESYVEMPMSELFLFGRSQDYSYAHAEPIQVVSTRNHLRMWKTGMTFHGEPVWAGAATHDIGFEKDQRTGGVTHKIDPNIDAERQYVADTLSGTGEITALDYMMPSNGLREAKTATGGSFRSDGRVLVMMMGH